MQLDGNYIASGTFGRQFCVMVGGLSSDGVRKARGYGYAVSVEL